MIRQDWESTRSRANPLTSADLQTIRAGYEAWKPAADMARELGCALRTVYTRYADLRQEGAARNGPRPRRVVRNRRDPTTLENPGNSQLMNWIKDHLGYDRDDCLIWPFGRATSGYGTLGRGGRQHYVHRFICEAIHGPAPKGHQAAHSCGRGDQGCVNPRHLSWKTVSDNQKDRAQHGTEAIGRRSKISEWATRAIKEAKGAEPPQVTAKRFAISEARVRQIQRTQRLPSPETRAAS